MSAIIYGIMIFLYEKKEKVFIIIIYVIIIIIKCKHIVHILKT